MVNFCISMCTGGSHMIIQNCPLLLAILTKVEDLILELKAQEPQLSDEEVIESLKTKLAKENSF